MYSNLRDPLIRCPFAEAAVPGTHPYVRGNSLIFGVIWQCRRLETASLYMAGNGTPPLHKEQFRGAALRRPRGGRVYSAPG